MSVSDALAHLLRRFVGEGDSQDRRRRHSLRGDQMRDAMRNDARFAATCPGQDQERPFRTSYGLALLGIESLEKIHWAWGDS